MLVAGGSQLSSSRHCPGQKELPHPCILPCLRGNCFWWLVDGLVQEPDPTSIQTPLKGHPSSRAPKGKSYETSVAITGQQFLPLPWQVSLSPLRGPVNLTIKPPECKPHHLFPWNPPATPTPERVTGCSKQIRTHPGPGGESVPPTCPTAALQWEFGWNGSEDITALSTVSCNMWSHIGGVNNVTVQWLHAEKDKSNPWHLETTTAGPQ